MALLLFSCVACFSDSRKVGSCEGRNDDHLSNQKKPTSNNVERNDDGDDHLSNQKIQSKPRNEQLRGTSEKIKKLYEDAPPIPVPYFPVGARLSVL